VTSCTFGKPFLDTPFSKSVMGNSMQNSLSTRQTLRYFLLI